jgi:hypothetical protein
VGVDSRAMAKKDKKNKKKDSPHAGDTVRDAVERTFQNAAGGAAATRDRAQEVIDDIVARMRELVDERRVVEALERLRDEVQNLGGRVSALEGRVRPSGRTASSARSSSATTTPVAPAAKPAARRSTAAKSGARRSTATKRATTARSSATKSSGASRSTATKSAASGRSTAAKSSATGRSAAAKSSGTGRSAAAKPARKPATASKPRAKAPAKPAATKPAGRGS